MHITRYRQCHALNVKDPNDAELRRCDAAHTVCMTLGGTNDGASSFRAAGEMTGDICISVVSVIIGKVGLPSCRPTKPLGCRNHQVPLVCHPLTTSYTMETHVNTFCCPPATKYLAAVFKSSPTLYVPLGTNPTFSRPQTTFWVTNVPMEEVLQQVKTGASTI